MTTNTRKSLSDSEKQELLSGAMEIITCGDAKIVKAFAAKVEEAVDIVRSVKAKPTKKGKVPR